MRHVAESFTWPFRGSRRQVWAIGLVSVLLLPLLFIPLLGYAVAATRAAEIDPSAGPPHWRLSGRLLTDGAWVLLALLLTTVPFAFLVNPLAALLGHLARGEPFAHLFALLVVALPWGVVALIFMPHATAAFAARGRPADLFNYAESVRSAARDFATWNTVVAAIVTAWALGLACAGLLCVGIVPGVFYAILVSAHASATLYTESQDQDPSTR